MEFLGIGVSELIFIFIIALMVLGPRRLPEYAAKAGKTIRDLRNMSQGFLTEWQREIAVATRIDELEETRRELQEAQKMLRETHRSIASETATVTSETSKAMSEAAQIVSETATAAPVTASPTPDGTAEVASEIEEAASDTPQIAAETVEVAVEGDDELERTIKPPQPASKAAPSAVPSPEVLNE